MRKLTSYLGLSALAVVGACDDERSSVFEPVGEISIDVNVGPAVARLPQATVSIAAGVATVSAAWLREVSGAGYHFWYVSRDPTTGADIFTPAYGTILEFFMRDSLTGGTTGDPVLDPITDEPIQVLDTNVVTTTRVASYTGTDVPAVFTSQIRLDSAQDVGLTNPATGRNAVVVSLGNGSQTDAMFLFRRIGVSGGGALTFGNFGGADPVFLVSASDYVFNPGGAGVMGFRGAEAAANFRELRRPPEGFFYRGFLVDTTGTAILVDTLRSAYSPVPELSRVSLFDADVNPLLPGIAVGSITHSQVRNCATGSGVNGCQSTMALPVDATFGGMASFILTLDPKGVADDLGQTVILSAAVPERVSR